MLKHLSISFFVMLAFLSVPALQAQEPLNLQQQIDTVNAFTEENDTRLKAISFFANIGGEEKLLYLDQQWQNGVILTKEGTKLFFTGRFEVLNQTVEVNIGGQIRVLSVAYASLVKIGERIFLPVQKEQIKGIYKDIYAELLYNGKAKLFAFYETQTKQIRQGISNSAPAETSLSYRERFFVSTDLELFRPLPSKKKMVTELFQSKGQKVAAYIKENRLKRNKADLIQLFYYYDQIEN